MLGDDPFALRDFRSPNSDDGPREWIDDAPPMKVYPRCATCRRPSLMPVPESRAAGWVCPPCRPARADGKGE